MGWIMTIPTESAATRKVRRQRAAGALWLESLISVLIWVSAIGCTGAALGQDSPEDWILTVDRARDLAQDALADAVVPLGNLLNQLGPAGVFASAGDRLPSSWSISLGATASGFDITNPDYTVTDPRGADRIDGTIGAVYVDASAGLFRGYGASTGTRRHGSVELLLRAGATLGDQPDLANKVDFSRWAPIFGAGLRIGVLQGQRVPAVSLSMGVNYLARRTFTVRIEDSDDRDAEVNLTFRQTSGFLLLEAGYPLGVLTPYFAGGVAHHRLEAHYTAEVFSGDSYAATIRDAVDDGQGIGTLLGGLEFGRGTARWGLEAGVSGKETFGQFYFRLVG
jgi:hypothetical protein